jgi:hypothetical protein
MACFPAPNNGLFRWHGRMSSALGSRATPVEKKKKITQRVEYHDLPGLGSCFFLSFFLSLLPYALNSLCSSAGFSFTASIQCVFSFSLTIIVR